LIIGWQAGISYESPTAEGNDLPHMLRLLDEMAEHGMNYLSLMMTSYARFDPGHDGFCWPVKDQKLECLRDKTCLNADAKTEFISKVIDEAKQRNIGIQLFSNLTIYNPERIRVSFPNAAEQQLKNGELCSWLFCPTSADVWDLEQREIADLLALYNHPNVKSVGYERLSFAPGSCYCPACAEEFKADTGGDIHDFTDEDMLFDRWKTDVITAKMKLLNEKIKSIKPGTQVYLHSSCAEGWGHDPNRLKGALIDAVMPHIAHFETTQAHFNALLDRLAPNDLVLQVCVRNKALNNYPIWTKTPEMIGQFGDWINEYHEKDNRLRGVLFFNENTVCSENRKAVYEVAKRLK